MLASCPDAELHRTASVNKKVTPSNRDIFMRLRREVYNIVIRRFILVTRTHPGVVQSVGY